MIEDETNAPALSPPPAEARLAAYAAAAEGAFAGNTLRALRADTAVYLAWAKAADRGSDMAHGSQVRRDRTLAAPIMRRVRDKS